MLKVDNISKTYPGERFGALNEISLIVEKNEILALVGKSGSGKSTLLQIISGLMKPDRGRVIFKGQLLENPEEQLIAGHKDIKMVFQDFQVKPNMTVEENINYKLLQFEKDYREQRCDELIEVCNLTNLKSKKPNELSGGQRQRLSIARALADDPELLLMDEPFSNLDPLTKEELLIEVMDIVRHEELSLIFVTHDTRDAMFIADRIAFVSEGSLIQNGTSYEVYKTPKNLQIAQFFGRVNDVSSIVNVKNSFVRAEDMMLVDKAGKLDLKVVRSIYLGDRYLNEGHDSKEISYFFYSSVELRISGFRVNLNFLRENVLCLKD